jgi:hypothetical protein
MSISSTAEQPAVQRAREQPGLVRDDEFPPVRHFIDGGRPLRRGPLSPAFPAMGGRTVPAAHHHAGRNSSAASMSQSAR